MQRRVVVTGVGLVTPLATGVEETWRRILAGESGIRQIRRFDASTYPTTIAGEVLDFNPEDWLPKKSIRRLDTFIHFAAGATRMAWEMAGMGDALSGARADRTGCVIGVGLGGMQTLEDGISDVLQKGADARVSPFYIPRLIGNMAAGQVAMQFGCKGPNLCISTACAAGSHAVGEAMKLIQRGATDAMVCGGAEAVITSLTLKGFSAAKALSTRNDDPEKASRPFERDRDGFVMSEGSGILILEELDHALERGANILAEIKGYGLSSDAYHMTAPDPEGEGFSRCMRMALDDGGFKPEDIDYINAHGTSTGLNDLVETRAIKATFGGHSARLAVSSTKSMIGHMLGATGGVEAAFTVLSLRDQVMPPTINYENPDPECDLDYVPNVKREAGLKTALSNSFGFGGTNASLIFTTYQA